MKYTHRLNEFKEEKGMVDPLDPSRGVVMGTCAHHHIKKAFT